jgi:hypothetical protein
VRERSVHHNGALAMCGAAVLGLCTDSTKDQDISLRFVSPKGSTRPGTHDPRKFVREHISRGYIVMAFDNPHIMKKTKMTFPLSHLDFL